MTSTLLCFVFICLVHVSRRLPELSLFWEEPRLMFLHSPDRNITFSEDKTDHLTRGLIDFSASGSFQADLKVPSLVSRGIPVKQKQQRIDLIYPTVIHTQFVLKIPFLFCNGKCFIISQYTFSPRTLGFFWISLSAGNFPVGILLCVSKMKLFTFVKISCHTPMKLDIPWLFSPSMSTLSLGFKLKRWENNICT